MKSKKCTSCGTDISNDPGNVEFMCPGCGKTEVVRCTQCRKITTKYKCKECGFEGPN